MKYLVRVSMPGFQIYGYIDRRIVIGNKGLVRNQLGLADPLSSFLSKSNVRFWLSLQPVDATHALNRSAGVSNSNVSRGRSFNSRATLFKVA
jgi:hypothetical protein